ncbi:LysR family transcriptional regulator [Pseudolactococcus reticulitermitis]|uniref:HTH lysR-type domain-containing protein n=1 Tax=Pseudolactococcus reticulitermitis TaxID=2025039 RepID=A0A224XAR5_9LACT|nr:LysR family transcriptional regulator [Lactococcus reticulitermitis]GAX46753.1 hypothetical protein RsY01_332 [Lactococcus reticulitermitis]
MNFNDLNIFIGIYETGSLNQSAVNLGYAQSNLTARLKKLESEMGTLLFIRKYNGIVPTQNGDKLYYFAKETLQNLEILQKAFESQGKSILISELLLNYDLNQEQSIDIGRDSVSIKKMRDIPIEAVKNKYDAIYSFQKIVNLRGFKETKKVLSAFYLSSDGKGHPENHQFFVNCDKTCPFREKTLNEFSDTQKIIELDSFENIINCVENAQGIALLPDYLLKTKKLQKWDEEKRVMPYYVYD